MSKLIVSVVLCLSLQYWQSALGASVYKTIKMECHPNPAYIANATCQLKAVGWQKALSNMDCDLVQPLRNVSLHLQIFAKDYSNQFKPFLVNVTTNLCDILDKRLFPAYTMIVMRILRDVSNVNHSCPYTGHLKAKDLYLDERFLPIEPPQQVYKVVFHFLEGWPYKDIGTVVLYIQSMEKLRARKTFKKLGNSTLTP